MKVILIAAGTICGRISPAGFGSGLDRDFLEAARGESDASLMGAQTLRESDPEMKIAGVIPQKRIRAVISGSGDIPIDNRKLFAGKPLPVIFTGEKGSKRLEQNLAGRARIIILPEMDKGLSISRALDELRGLGAEKILIEGGGKLNYAALKQGVVDEIYLTLAPYVSGDENAASLADGPCPLGLSFMQLELYSCEPQETGEVFLRYRVQKEKS
ncbi:MAG: dihydrofolate reductase family protein [Proteobacteria bacterium]|nr:dihydrofolate reductase family protein [Pseudomonadota bacterium]MBU1711102.1 dihydrofolate reductase family protein [Pseudomonadota bacterium]